MLDLLVRGGTRIDGGGAAAATGDVGAQVPHAALRFCVTGGRGGARGAPSGSAERGSA